MIPASVAEPADEVVEEVVEEVVDERVLNAGTTQRFVLLLVLFVAESTGTTRDFVARLTAASGGDGGAIPAWVSYAGPVLLVAAAIYLYRALPGWKGRHSVAVERFGDVELLSELAELVALAKLEHPPRFVVDPGASSASAVVFGTGRHPTVRLNAGLIIMRGRDRARFRAVVLHELAHIHNRDVGITYATEAMWRVLLGAVMLPDAVLIVLTWLAGASAVGMDTLVPKAVIVVLVYLTRADILRRREIYADRTAVRLGEVDHDALLPRTWDRHRNGRPRAVAALGEMWRTHPSWRLRGRSLVAPDELFAVRRLPMVITGLAAAVASARLVTPFGSANSWLGMLQFALISVLVVGIGGVALWRAMVHAVLRKLPIPSGWAVGVWLGAGLAAGELVNGESGGGWRLPAYPAVLLVLIGVVALLMAWTAQFAELRIRTYRGESLNVAMVAGLVPPWLVLGFVLLWWHTGAWDAGWQFSVSDALAHAGLPTRDAPPLLRMGAVLTALPGSDLGFNGLWWAVPLLWLVPVQLWLARLPRSAPSWPTRSSGAASRWWRAVPKPIRVVVGMGGVPAVLFGLLFAFIILISGGPAGYFALAVLAWLMVLRVSRNVRQQRITNPSPYWLDQARPGSAPPAVDAPELRWVIRTGVLGGLACWLGLLALPLVTRHVRAPRSWQVDSVVVLAGTVVVLAIGMTVVAAVAARSSRGRYPLITALIAAGVTAVVGLAGQYLKSTLDGCLGPFNSVATGCAWEPIRYLPLVDYALGFALGPALLVAGLVAAVVGVLSRRSAAAADAPADGAAEPRQLARPMVAVGFVNALAVCLIGSVTAHQTVAMAAPIPRTNLLFAYRTSPTGPMRTGTSTLTEWMRYVSATLRRQGDALGYLGNALRAADAHDDPADFVTTVHTTTRRGCAVLTDIVTNAEAEGRLYDPSPAQEAEHLWLRYLAALRVTERQCLTFTHADTRAAILAGGKDFVADLQPTAAAAKALVDWLGETY